MYQYFVWQRDSTLPNTDYAHKTSQVISVMHIQYFLRMDPKGAETCRSF